MLPKEKKCPCCGGRINHIYGPSVGRDMATDEMEYVWEEDHCSDCDWTESDGSECPETPNS